MALMQQTTQPPVHLPWWRAHALAVLAFVAGLILWSIFVLGTHHQLEDAHITFRHVANLLHGDGLVFNPGERVLGTTTPLGALLLALCAWPFGADAVPAVAMVVMPLCGLAAGVVGYLLLVRHGIPKPAAALGMAIFYAHPHVIRTGIGGMETPLVLLLMLLSLWACGERRYLATGVLCGLLLLTRIDGIIWVGLVFIASLRFTRRQLLLQAAACVAVLLPWLIVATLYYGSPVPHTVIAKGVVRPGMERVLLDPARIMAYIEWYASGMGLPWRWATLPWFALVALGMWRVSRIKGSVLGVIAAFPLAFAVIMYAGRSPRFTWYLLPITLCALFLGAIGVHDAWRRLAGIVFARIPRAQFPASAGIVVLLLPVYIWLVGQPTLHTLTITQQNEDAMRRGAGLWLRRHTPPDATVSMEAIGYQGYFSRRYIIDTAGLITPRVTEYQRHTRDNAQVFEWIREELRPDYIVLRSFEVDTNRHFNGGPLFATPEKAARFHATYREAVRFAAPNIKRLPDGSPDLNASLLCRITIYQRIPPADSAAKLTK